MRSYFSIVYAGIRPNVDERISVGLLLANDESVRFDFSTAKLAAVSKLIPDSGRHMLVSSLRAIKEAINNRFTRHADAFSEGYLEYLSKYANNLLTFDPPRIIDFPNNTDPFPSLFIKYVSDAEQLVVATRRQNVSDVLETELLPRIENRVNWKCKIGKKELSTVVVPSITVDAIGKNGHVVLTQAFDFDSVGPHLPNSLFKFFYIANAFEHQTSEPPKIFVVGHEPSMNLKVNHDIWREMREATAYDLVDTSELDLIADYLETNDVRPYFTPQAEGEDDLPW